MVLNHNGQAVFTPTSVAAVTWPGDAVASVHGDVLKVDGDVSSFACSSKEVRRSLAYQLRGFSLPRLYLDLTLL